MRGRVQKERQRVRRGLSPFANRIYDEAVARDDSHSDGRKGAQTVGERHIVSAYIEGSEYEARRVEFFRPGASFFKRQK